MSDRQRLIIRFGDPGDPVDETTRQSQLNAMADYCIRVADQLRAGWKNGRDGEDRWKFEADPSREF
ncbi:hypothetical protein AB0H71_13825 [Nocardia sp. NPDC050697]|uniref:hypothetical protein n=1 Tax=Nocardia sp. NPDC050697 TaxID=3155158 RepID=UPI0033D982F4